MTPSKFGKKIPARTLGGWELKPYAILHSAFREVLFLDADNVPVVNPEFLFESPQFRRFGAIFWPDLEPATQARAAAIWRSCGLRPPAEPEFESGQMMFDKQRCWGALRLALWFNENSDFYYQHLYGDKETFHLAFRKLRQPYALVPHPIHSLAGTMCQHDFDGRRIFQHRNRDKWDLMLHNRRVADFQFEKECRQYLDQLRRRWDGGLRLALDGLPRRRRRRLPVSSLRFEAVVMACPGWEPRPAHTLKNLALTDWNHRVSEVQAEPLSDEDPRTTQLRCAYQALKRGLATRADYVLLLEDHLELNHHLDHNLRHWRPLQDGRVTLAGLYNPRAQEVACDIANNARLMDPRGAVVGGALVISRRTLEHVVRHWHRVNGPHSFRLARLAGRLQQPFYYHAPSLAQPLSSPLPEIGSRPAIDFNPGWRA